MSTTAGLQLGSMIHPLQPGESSLIESEISVVL